MERVTFLRIAVERVKAVKLINENSFGHKRKYFNKRKREQIEDNKEKKDKENNNGNNNTFKTRNGTKVSNKRECDKEGSFSLQVFGQDRKQGIIGVSSTKINRNNPEK